MILELPDCYWLRRVAASPNILCALLLVASFIGADGTCAIQAQTPNASAKHAQVMKLYADGIAQAKGGRIDLAIATFNEGLKIEPENAALLDATGAAFSLKGDLEDARRFFVESLQLDPGSVSTRQNLGITLFGLGQYDDAAQQFRTLQRIEGKARAVANLFLGMIAAHHSNCKEAIPLLESSPDLLRRYPEALLTTAECYQSIGNGASAVRFLKRLGQLATVTPAEYLQAADLYSRLGQGAIAEQYRKRAHSIDKEVAAGVLRQSVSLEKENCPEEAEKLLQQEVATRPTFDLLMELAKVAKGRGDFAIAMKSLKQASKFAPSQEESYLEFSTICADHGNDQLALDSAEIGLDHVPTSYRLTVQEGVEEAKLHRLTDAEATLRKAIGMQKDNSVALLSLAVVQAQSGRLNEAVKTLTASILRFPENYYMHYLRGKLLLESPSVSPRGADHIRSARQSLETAIRLNPGYADAYFQLSKINMNRSPKLAEQELRKCLHINPAYIPAQYALGRLLVRTGRKAEGAALLARLKSEERADDQQQQKRLLIEVAKN